MSTNGRDRNPLAGKTILVTGASSGIGEATARELARRGASVALVARNAGKLDTLAGEISSGGGVAFPVPADVSDRSSVEAAIEAVVGRFGGLYGVVNNAGMGLSGRVAELRVEDLRHVYEVNVIGAVNLIQVAVPRLEAGGRIVNVSSVVGLRSLPMVGGYCSSKSALNALSDALRVEVAHRGLHVTSVYPGTTTTAFRENSRRTGSEKRGWRPKGVPPEKVARVIRRALEADRPPRDAYVSFKDHAFVVGTALFPGLTDLALRSWAKG
ncbi:Short-chain dehydrogenase of various substrate specificities [Rubrobacter radiotolerans]|uniref:Short-chain dehydrogenase of various substrate specificities n=1 Tax=Rubrobacter radiotolerans TaxID=42256 RepID=A0A023WYJ9_RUBRA|nr:Short-chain dehydrogenase of various substrate specificities [Rubrobacter radiotolerans]SMC02338.1 Short-chain dehydrogenase [Rubrobacter radiotolerans DSM 5868]